MKKITKEDISLLKDYIEHLEHEIERLKEENKNVKGAYKSLKSLLDEICERLNRGVEYIEKHTIEYVDARFISHNIMCEFDEYSNPQALKDILTGDNE